MCDFGFERLEFGEDLFGRDVFDPFVDDLFVSIEGKVEAVGGDVGERNAEALRSAGAVVFGAVALGPASDDVGKVVLRVFRFREHRPAAEFFFREERLAFVIERPAVGFHVVEPDVIRSAGVGFGEEENGGRHAGVGLEDAGGQRHDRVQFVAFDQRLA